MNPKYILMDFSKTYKALRAGTFILITILSAGVPAMAQQQQQDHTYDIPADVKLSRDGHKPVVYSQTEFTWDETITRQEKPVFPTCFPDSLYYVGFQLEYDARADRNTKDLWLANISIALLHGEDTVWKKPLQNDMPTQTFQATVFHPSAINCQDDYRYVAVKKTEQGDVPGSEIHFRVLYYKKPQMDFNPSAGFAPNSLGYQRSGNDVTVHWEYAGASPVGFDVEWVYIADYETRFTGSTGAEAFAFKEPAGVSVENTTYYKHQVYYPKGRIWYRVRAIGANPKYPDHRIEGEWFYMPDVLPVDNHQADMTWQERTVFAEEGKYKKIMTYYDGSFRQRQQQTNLSTAGISLTGETYYDYEGRPSITVLPSPAINSALTYKTNLAVFETKDAAVSSVISESSKRRKFNYDNYRLENSILSATQGASKYYSPSNASSGILNQYIPDAEGYVYTQTEYTNDGTGRISRQSGIGPAFKMDGAHATRYYYGEANAEELKRLFGSNVGNEAHYKKNLVVDPNGQVSVTYLDQEGRTIATALAGDPPANVDALKSYTDLQPFTPVTRDISSKNDRSAGVSQLSHKILNEAPNTSYTFHYSLNAFGVVVAAFGCQTCSYDLTVTITDPDGKLLPLGAIAGNQNTDANATSYLRKGLSAAECNSATSLAIDFTVVLPEIGDYTVTKVLTPAPLSYEQMASVISQNASVQQQIQNLTDSYVIDPQDCDICTQSCPGEDDIINDAIDEIATLDCDNIYQQILQALRDAHPGDDEYEPTDAEIQGHALYCKYTLCHRNKDSDIFDKQMARPQNWEAAGQYINAIDIDPFFNNTALSGYSKKGDMQSLLSNFVVQSTNPYTGAVEHEYKGSLLTISDPTNTAYYINDDGTPNPNGKHVLYLDLMSKKSTMSTEDYNEQLSEQHWIIYRNFYADAKRKLKAATADYQACPAALEESNALDNLPKTPEGVAAYGDNTNGAGGGPVSDEEVGMSVYSITSACHVTLSSDDNTAISAYLKTYFNAHAANVWRIIDADDLASGDPNLVAINTILGKYGCNLSAVAQINPLTCVEEKTVTVPGRNGVPVKAPFTDPKMAAARQSAVAFKREIPLVPATQSFARVASISAEASGIISESQYRALLDFYAATGGDNWVNNTGWKDADPNPAAYDVTGWYGVTTYNGNVTQIILNNNGLNGVIPQTISDLSFLSGLYLNVNGLYGNIPPEFGDMRSLYYLGLSSNQFQGSIPSELEHASNLTYLLLDHNQLEGGIPSWLSKLHLATISLSENPLLGGSIPSELGNIAQLWNLSLINCGLTGSIPSSLGNCSNLVYLELSKNNLTGSIPPELGNLSAIIDLAFDNNKLSGSIPDIFGNMPVLDGLDLHNNNFTGVIPPSLTTCPKLRLTFLSNNKLSGDIPWKNGFPADWQTIGGTQIDSNRYTFKDLVYLATLKDLIYDPQDSVDLPRTVIAKVGDRATFTAAVDQGTTSRYQWFKYVNGVSTALTSILTNGYNYTITSVKATDKQAKYYYQITNSKAPFLTLVSRFQTLVTLEPVTYKICLQYDTNNPTLGNITYVVDWAAQIQKCMDRAAEEKQYVTQYAIDKLVEAQVSTFYNTYKANCLNKLSESLKYEYSSKEHHYTLYYYDQAGNVVQTVPPEGVHPATVGQTPAHTLVSRYKFNSLGQVIWQKTPDAGESNFWVNDKGQVRISQNAQQAIDKRYSYSRYNEQGRVVEVGEMKLEFLPAALSDSLNLQNFPDQRIYTLNDVTRTIYDFAAKGLSDDRFKQEYLRYRVSHTEVVDQNASDTTAIYFSYDVHGNVKSILQHIPGLPDKQIDYVYDLVSSKIKYAIYQYGRMDQFIHEYEYDSDNRISKVSTSSDGFVWYVESNYDFYIHGPLARQELGEYRVQGLDYFYTNQGWIKGVNMPFLGDPSNDGSSGSGVGRDAYAYTVGYYQDDYKPIGGSAIAVPDSRDHIWSRLQQTLGYTGLYNSNVSWMVTDLPKIGQVAKNRALGMQTMLYKYDQLHRIVASKSLTSYNAVNGFAGRTSPDGAYDENYSYDGNGNILTLYRLNSKGTLLNDFHYRYYDKSNKLKEVNPLARDTAYHSGAIPYTRKLYNKINVDGSAHITPGKFIELLATDSITFDADFSAPLGSDFVTHLKPGLGTYVYDALGNLVRDYDEGLKIEWTPYGKIRKVQSHNDSISVTFRYDGAGNRIEKNVSKPDTTYVTHYVYDATGNIMSIYNDTTAIEQPIHGNGRIGTYVGGVVQSQRTLGKRKYELVNHQGNILAVVTDKLNISADSTWASVATVTDYYPFGLSMDGRHLTATPDTASSVIPVKMPFPVAQYTFNGNAQDMTGHGYNGTVTGPVLTTDNQGNVDNAYHFDGVNDVIRLANTKDSLAFIQNTAVFTMAAFIKVDDVNARSVFICSANTASAKGFTFMYENYDATYGLHQLRFSMTTGITGQVLIAKGAQNTINDTNWHHVAVVGNGTSVRFYVDGVADGTTTPVKYLSTGASAKDVAIGAIPNPSTNAIALPYKGAIDEINIFKKALNPDEIESLAQRGTVENDIDQEPAYYAGNGYRYGFNGQEKDNKGEFGEDVYAFKYRMYNPALGRFLSFDPLASKYPHNSPYAFAENKVGLGREIEGLELQYTAPGAVSLAMGYNEAYGSGDGELGFGDFVGGIGMAFLETFTPYGTAKRSVNAMGNYSRNEFDYAYNAPSRYQEAVATGNDPYQVTKAYRFNKAEAEIELINVQIEWIGWNIGGSEISLTNTLKVGLTQTQKQLGSALREYIVQERANLTSANQLKDFKTATVAYDRVTGKTYFGRNAGIVRKGFKMHEVLKKHLPEKAINDALKLGNCAECDAMNEALLNGSQWEDVQLHTFGVNKDGTIWLKPQCDNCHPTFLGTKANNKKLDVYSGPLSQP